MARTGLFTDEELIASLPLRTTLTPAARLGTTPQTAVYVLARTSGEGSDRTPEAGDLSLTNTEIRDILALNERFERFLLVLNVGGVVDLSPLDDVANILLLSQLGATVGDAFADVLLGRAYPSGKLATTWAAWDEAKRAPASPPRLPDWALPEEERVLR